MNPESSESTWFYEALAWFELNRKRVIACAIVVLAIVVAGYIYDWHRKTTQREAERALFALKERPGPEETTRGPSAPDLLKIVDSHPGTSAAQRALLLAATDLFDDQKYAEAQAKFEQFAAKYSSSPLAPIAFLGIASCLDAQNKVEEAMSAYQRLINQFPAEPAAGRARLHLAIIHEQKNQPEQALRLYEELNRPNTFSSVAAEAAKRRERLLQKHPELASVRQPTVSTNLSTPPPQTTGTTSLNATQAVLTPKQDTAPASQSASPKPEQPETPQK